MLARKLTEEHPTEYTKEDYYSLPEGTRAELINGVIYNMSPAPLRIHQKLVAELSYSIQHFIKTNKGSCEVYPAPFDVELSDNTIVQPDLSVICDINKLTEKGCTGAPDWVIEITSSNTINDYVYKLHLYKDYGVKEYWIINPKKENVIVYLMSDGFEFNHYTFNDTIPVGIYDNKLEIKISELL